MNTSGTSVRPVSRRWLIALLMLLSVLAPAAVRAQQGDPYYLEMRERLLRAGAVLVMAGFQLSHEPNVQTYQRNRYRDLTLTLEGGRQFALVAVGDDDARNIDMQLFDQQGDLIGQDVGPSAVAMVQVNTYYTARYTLRVIMRQCDTLDSYVGVGVFVRVR